MSSNAAVVPVASAASATTIGLGLDVHKESVTIAVLRGDAATPDRVDRLPNDLEAQALPGAPGCPGAAPGGVRSERTVIRIPTEAEERVRDLVRCRETFQREILTSRHYLLKFLARRGCV